MPKIVSRISIIFILLAACYLSLVTAVRAQVTCFVITTPGFTTTESNPSPTIIVEAQDNFGNLDFNFSDTVNLFSSSLTGLFSVDGMNWQDTDAITLVGGRKFFYYRDPQSCGPEGVVITVSRDGLTPAVQSETVQIPAVNASASFIIVASNLVPSDGVNPCTVIITVNDTFGFPVPGKQVTIFTTRGALDVISQPLTFTDSNGQCTGAVFSENPGADTVFALCEAVTVTRGVDLTGAEGIWHFDKDYKDYSGKIYDVLDSGAMWVNDGIAGRAIRFDGRGAYAWCSASTTLDTVVSIEAWVKTETYPPENSAQMLGKMNGPGNGPWIFSLWPEGAGSFAAMEIMSQSQGLYFGDQSTPEPIPLNEWMHFAGVYEQDGDFKTYVNGVERGALSFAFNLGDDGSCTMMLSSNYPTSAGMGGVFGGAVDEVKVYSRALSADDIAVLYNRRCRIAFTTGIKSFSFLCNPFASTKDNPTRMISVEALDGKLERIGSFSDTVDLSSSSPGGRFSVSSTEWADTSVIYFTAGTVVFYYKDGAAGNPTITISRQGFAAESLTGIIEENAPSFAASYIRTDTYSLAADGISSAQIVMTMLDTYGYPVTGKQATILTNRGILDTVTQPAGVSDANGQATGSIISDYGGDCHITGLCEGSVVAQNLLDNPSFEQESAGWMPINAALSDTAYSGRRSLYLYDDGSGNLSDGEDGDWIPVSNDANSVYEVSAFIRANVIKGTYTVQVYYYDEINNPAGLHKLEGIGSTQSWKYISCTYGGPGSGASQTFPDTCAKIRICAACWYNETDDPAGEGWTDSTRVKRIPGISFAGSGPSALVFSTSERTVDAGGVSDTISAQAQFANGMRAFGFNDPCTFTSSSVFGRFSATGTGSWSSGNTIACNFSDGEAIIFDLYFSRFPLGQRNKGNIQQ